MSLVTAVDPNWKPAPSLRDPNSTEGEIADLEAQTQQAQARVSEVTGFGATPAPDGGHHYFPRALFEAFEKVPLQQATREVFEDAASGPLADPTANLFTAAHRAYNEAVAQAFRNFLQERDVASEQMTPDQARDFLYEIFQSTDPRIRDFNMRIFKERGLHLLRNRLLGGGSTDADQ